MDTIAAPTTPERHQVASTEHVAGSANAGNGNPTVLRRLFGVVADPQSYRNIAYLLLGLPIGIVSFTVLVTAVSIGISTVVLALLGIPILVGCWYLARSFANVERAAANTLLGQHLTPVAIDALAGNPWARLRLMTADRAGWRELGFVLLRFPVGIATFAASVALLAASAALAYAPFYARYDDDTSFGDWTMSSRLEDIASSSPWSWLLLLLAALLLIASLHLMNRLGDACGRWATAWLGSTQSPASTAVPVRSAVTPGGFGGSAFLRVHTLTFATVMAALVLIDIADGASVWVHWPLITWGAVLGLHTTLVRGRSLRTETVGRQLLRTHAVVFASTMSMLGLIDMASGDGLWFYWPLAIWGTLLLIHEVAVRGYGQSGVESGSAR